eukprot:jgi/Tetstr1/428252/TSEL_018291.t1
MDRFGGHGSENLAYMDYLWLRRQDYQRDAFPEPSWRNDDMLRRGIHMDQTRQHPSFTHYSLYAPEPLGRRQAWDPYGSSVFHGPGSSRDPRAALERHAGPSSMRARLEHSEYILRDSLHPRHSPRSPLRTSEFAAADRCPADYRLSALHTRHPAEDRFKAMAQRVEMRDSMEPEDSSFIEAEPEEQDVLRRLPPRSKADGPRRKADGPTRMPARARAPSLEGADLGMWAKREQDITTWLTDLQSRDRAAGFCLEAAELQMQLSLRKRAQVFTTHGGHLQGLDLLALAAEADTASVELQGVLGQHQMLAEEDREAEASLHACGLSVDKYLRQLESMEREMKDRHAAMNPAKFAPRKLSRHLPAQSETSWRPAGEGPLENIASKSGLATASAVHQESGQQPSCSARDSPARTSALKQETSKEISTDPTLKSQEPAQGHGAGSAVLPPDAPAEREESSHARSGTADQCPGDSTEAAPTQVASKRTSIAALVAAALRRQPAQAESLDKPAHDQAASAGGSSSCGIVPSITHMQMLPSRQKGLLALLSHRETASYLDLLWAWHLFVPVKLASKSNLASSQRAFSGKQEQEPAIATPAAKKPKKSRNPPRNYTDADIDAYIGRHVTVPGKIFKMPMPYYAVVTARDLTKPNSVICQFQEDNSEYWFPLDDVRKWLAAQGGIVVKLREGANDGLERNLVATRSGVPKIHAIIAGVDVNVVLDSKAVPGLLVIQSSGPVEEDLQQIQADPSVEYAERDTQYFPQSPEGPYSSYALDEDWPDGWRGCFGRGFGVWVVA